MKSKITGDGIEFRPHQAKFMKFNNKVTGATCLALAGVVTFLLTGILAARTQEALQYKKGRRNSGHPGRAHAGGASTPDLRR